MELPVGVLSKRIQVPRGVGAGVIFVGIITRPALSKTISQIPAGRVGDTAKQVAVG